MSASLEFVVDLGSFARIRFEMVLRLHQNRPLLVVPHRCA